MAVRTWRGRPYFTPSRQSSLLDLAVGLARRLRADPANAVAVLVALMGYGQAHGPRAVESGRLDRHFVKPVDSAALSQPLAVAG